MSHKRLSIIRVSVRRDTFCRCLYYSANALSRKLTRMAEHEFKSTGLPPSHGFVVIVVNKQPGITAGEIADVMQLRPSTVTRLVDRLAESGYVTRQTDGKFMQIHPTAKATRLDEPLKTAWQNLYRGYSGILGEKQSKELTAAIFGASNKLEAD